MQRDGGPGGGGPVGAGNSFTGAASGIEIIGDHCYAYSGIGSAGTGGDFDALTFTTGNYYSVCRIYVLYDADDLNSGQQYGYLYSMNGVVIAKTRRAATANDIVDAPLPDFVDIIIPSYTEFTASAFSNATAVDTTFILTGRIYRG